jgi:EAL domain-containing protein (putative c-di-GMP-specific phosphodiesterase class I)
LEQSLRTALRNDELVLMYQPQFELNSRKLIGMEALIRWQHPEKGLIAPYEFLDIAEKIGLMEQIDHWVVQRACSDIQSWQATGLSVVPVSINQSHHQFGLHAHLDEWIALQLKKHNLSSSSLKVEVTETALMQNLSEAIDVLSRLAQLGIGIALDDFGTGYSSLAYLRRLPIQLLKIDRAFVQNVPEDKDDAIIVRSIIAMTKEMELQILAEGIETEAQLQFLTETGCVLGQGYLYSKPIDEVAMKQLMTSAAEV